MPIGKCLPGEFFWARDRGELEQAFPSQRGPGRSPPDLLMMVLMVMMVVAMMMTVW